MAKKPTITTVTSGYQATSTINNNFDSVRNAFDNFLSLDGSTPNAMESDLDLNSNDILNAGTVNTTEIVVGGINLTDQVTLAQDAADDAIAAATLAGTSQTSAATSATNAATSATAAASSASSASSSASAASSSASAAASSAAAAAASYDSFDDRYLGAKASDPTVDNDGNALLTGALYFNTTTGLKAYNGSAWLSLDGDMKKSTYDTDNDGIVDAAETVPWSGVSSTPTTISGYGITNAYTKTEVDTALALKLDDSQASAFGLSLLDDADASAARTTLGLGTLATQSGTFSGTSSGTNTGDQNLFSTIAVSGQSNVVADSTSDTLTLVAGSNVTITTDASTDSITISATGGGGGGGDAFVGSTNTFTANQIISVTDNTNAALRVTQLGTGEAIRVEDSTNPDSTPFVVSSSGTVGVGVSPVVKFQIYDAASSVLRVEGDATTLMQMYRYADDANASSVQLYKGRGTKASPTIISSGDTLGSIFGAGHNGSGNFNTITRIDSIADTVTSGTSMSSSIRFSTANAAASSAERLRIGPAGQLGIGGANYGTSGQFIKSGGSAAAPSWATITTSDVSGLGTLATQSGTFSGTSSGTNTGDQNLFSTIAVAGQSNVVADSTSDTLTLVAGSNVTITTDASTDTITIAASGGGGSGGATGGGSDQIFWNNGTTITTNYTIPTSTNAGTFGPVSINSGVTVTVPSSSTWTVV